MEEIDSADNLAQIIHGLLSLERKEKNIHRLAGIMHRNIRNSHLDIFSILPQKIREIWQISLHGSAVSRPYGQEKMSVSC